MAVEMNYEYETVQAGQSGSTGDGSPNNTCIEIANTKQKDYRIILALNPYLLSTGVIKGGMDGTKIIYVDTGQGPGKSYTVQPGSYNSSDTLSYISKKYGTSTDWLIRENEKVISEKICFAAGDKVLTAVGSMTDSIDSFITETHVARSISQNDNTTTDTLETIAKQYNKTVSDLLKLNPSISQTEKLKHGNVVLLSVKSPSEGTTVSITGFGIQSDTTRTLFIKWEWDTEVNKTQHYKILWEYQTADGEWWIGSETTTSDENTKESLWTADDKAIAVRVKVQPIAQSGMLSTTKYEWTTEQIHSFNENLVMLIPEITEVEFPEPYKMTVGAQVDLSKLSTGDKFFEEVHLQIKVIQDNKQKEQYKSTDFFNVTATNGYVSYTFDIAAGHQYSVAARSLRTRTIRDHYDNLQSSALYSSWSGYQGPFNAPPLAPTNLSTETNSETQITLKWKNIISAEIYNVEYAIKNEDLYKGYTPEDYFNNPTVDKETIQIPVDAITELDDEYVSCPISGLATGGEYYIRMNAQTKKSEPSEWSEIISFVLGTTPTAPTTWSSSSTAVVGETLRLYWLHNSEDESIERFAKLRLIINDIEQDEILITKSTDPKEKYETSFYEIDTNDPTNIGKIEWQVKTAGVLTDNDGNPVFSEDWSVKREVNIYAPPSLSLTITGPSGDPIGGSSYPVTSFPLTVNLSVGNTNENHLPTGYYLSISVSTKDGYETTDSVGNVKWVSQGTKVYSKYIDTTDTSVSLQINAGDVNLANNKEYLVSAVVAMNSGLNSEVESTRIKVGYNASEPLPLAEIKIDKQTLSAQIMPYSTNKQDEVSLSVYRREYDGSFTEIESNITNGSNRVAVDPHPSLNYARYRIVALNKRTGVSSYYDVPNIEVNEKSVIIQWDETWHSYNISSTGVSATQPYSGSMLKLPYNIDVSNNHSQDVSHVAYIGRKRPVSYYGTQLGESATWNVTIPKNDIETLYALRRLAVWMGDVYVREPSGSGYWASITVGFSQKHLDLTIPVTINITPVEGGK